MGVSPHGDIDQSPLLSSYMVTGPYADPKMMMGGVYGNTPGTPSTTGGPTWSLPSPDSSTRTPPSTASSDAFIMSSPVQSRGGWRRESGSRHMHMQQDSFNAFAYHNQQWANSNSNSSSSSSMAEEDWTYGVQVDGGVPLFDSTIPLIPQQHHTTAQNDTAAAAVYNGYTGVNSGQTQPLASISIPSNTAYPQGQQAFDWTMPQAGSTAQCGAPAVPVLTRPPGSRRHHSHPYKSSSGHQHAVAAPQQQQQQQYGWVQSPMADNGAQWPTSGSGEVAQTRPAETMQWATPDGKNPSYAMMFETMINSAPSDPANNAGAPYSGPSSTMFPSSWASQGPSSSIQFAPPTGYATLSVQPSSLSNDQIFDNVVPSSAGPQYHHHRSRSGQQQPQQGWRQ